ncbi:putative HVA22-like protein g [Tanacetum coccineum]
MNLLTKLEKKITCNKLYLNRISYVSLASSWRDVSDHPLSSLVDECGRHYGFNEKITAKEIGNYFVLATFSLPARTSHTDFPIDDNGHIGNGNISSPKTPSISRSKFSSSIFFCNISQLLMMLRYGKRNCAKQSWVTIALISGNASIMGGRNMAETLAHGPSASSGCSPEIQTQLESTHLQKRGIIDNEFRVIIAMLTIFERIRHIFISWVPMYGEMKLAMIIYLWYPKAKGYGMYIMQCCCREVYLEGMDSAMTERGRRILKHDGAVVLGRTCCSTSKW